MRSFEPRTTLGEPVKALTRSYEADDSAPRMQLGNDVPLTVRQDAEFTRLFRDSQKLKNSKRPKDQEALRSMLNEMRARWTALTGEDTHGN